MPAVESVCFQRYQDISKFTSYDELCNELACMFGLEGQFEDPQRSRWLLVFFDRANNVLIVGDDPWWIMKETSRIIEEKPGTIKHLVLNMFCVAVQHMVREEIEVSLSEGKIWNLKNPEKSTGSTSFQHDNPEQNTSFSDLISSLLETRSPPTPPKRCTRLSHDQEGDDVLNTNNGEFPGTNAVGSKIISTIHQPEQMVIPLDETYSVEAILEDIDDEVQETIVVESMINNTMDQGRSFQLDSTRVSSPQVGIILDMGDPMPPLLHDGDQFYTPSFENAFGVGTVTGYDLVDPPPCPQGFDSDLSEIYIGTNIWRSSWWDNENLEPYN